MSQNTWGQTAAPPKMGLTDLHCHPSFKHLKLEEFLAKVGLKLGLSAFTLRKQYYGYRTLTPRQMLLIGQMAEAQEGGG
jgi:hypothetical protein